MRCARAFVRACVRACLHACLRACVFVCVYTSERTYRTEKFSQLLVTSTIRLRWAGHVARMGEDRVVQRVVVGKPEGKRPWGRPRRRWVDNIKMDLQEVGGSRGDWMELAQDRDRWQALVGTVRDFRVP